MNTFGYARVSTQEQELQSQVDALSAVGCKKIFKEKASGARNNRPEQAALLATVQKDDTIVVTSLDRFGRSLPDLVSKVEALAERGVKFRSLQENIDTSTATGKLLLHFFAALAEFERARTRERTMAGLAAAAAMGRRGGRPKKANDAKIARALELQAAGMSKDEIAGALHVSRATVYRMFRELKT